MILNYETINGKAGGFGGAAAPAIAKSYIGFNIGPGPIATISCIYIMISTYETMNAEAGGFGGAAANISVSNL